LWVLLASDTPSTHPTITQAEVEYIETGLPATNTVSPPVPWNKIWTSLPFWSIVFSNMAYGWGFDLLMTELPQYLSLIFHNYMNSIHKTGLWSTIPYACMWVSSLTFSLISDLLIRKKILSSTTVRKIFNTISHLGPAICLLVIVIFSTNEDPRMELTLAMFILTVALMGAVYSGFFTNPQDIAPNFAGTILGLTNSIGSIPGFVAPHVASEILKSDDSDISKWRIVWIITIVIFSLESIFFIIFADGKPQQWNAPTEGKTDERKRDLFSIFFTLSIALVGVIYVGTMMTWNSIYG